MKRIFLVLAIVLILSVLFIVLFFYLDLNGGLEGWLSDSKSAPDWNASNIVEGRNSSIEKIRALQSEIQTNMRFNSDGASTHDLCVKGTHNYKINDSYAYKCTYEIINYYSFNSDFRSTMLDLDILLANNGWKNDMTITKMLYDYYDNTQDTIYGSTGLVSSLPSTQFYKNNSKHSAQPETIYSGLVSNLPSDEHYSVYNQPYLNIDYAQRETVNLDPIGYDLLNLQGGGVYNKIDPVNLQDIFKKATQKDKYFLIVSIRQEYFRN